MAVAVAMAVMMGSPGALGATPGTLTFNPANGTDIIAPIAHTSAGCPTGSDAYDAFVKGPGAFGNGDGFLMVPNQTPNFSTEHGFDVQFSLSMKDAATELGTTLVAGEYDVTVNCLDSFSQDVKASFTGALIFTSPTEYHSGTGPTGGPSASTSASASASASASPSDSPSASPSDSASASPSDSASPSASATPSASAPASGLPITGSPAAWYAGGGALLIGLGVAGIAASRRRRDAEARP
jgi:hypothetical protein